MGMNGWTAFTFLVFQRRSIARIAWHGQWLEPEGPTPYAVLCSLDGTRQAWCMNLDDMRATDWVELDKTDEAQTR